MLLCSVKKCLGKTAALAVPQHRVRTALATLNSDGALIKGVRHESQMRQKCWSDQQWADGTTFVSGVASMQYAHITCILRILHSPLSRRRLFHKVLWTHPSLFYGRTHHCSIDAPFARRDTRAAFSSYRICSKPAKRLKARTPASQTPNTQRRRTEEAP